VGQLAFHRQSMEGLEEAVHEANLEDLRYVGQRYTWWNHQEDTRSIHRKLDRGLVNESWMTKFPGSFAEFHPAGSSDHSPAIVTIDPRVIMKGRTSKI